MESDVTRETAGRDRQRSGWQSAVGENCLRTTVSGVDETPVVDFHGRHSHSNHYELRDRRETFEM